MLTILQEVSENLFMYSIKYEDWKGDSFVDKVKIAIYVTGSSKLVLTGMLGIVSMRFAWQLNKIMKVA